LKRFDSSHNALRLGAALICVSLASTLVQARAHRSQSWAETQFAKAESQRETLDGRAEPSRTRREYETVIASYRRVVLESPTSSKADGSAFAIAELTAEMGRHFKDDTALFSAVREYKFLRREYPGSKHRIEALLAIGEIYKNDLGDESDARGAFEELLRRYSHSKLVEEARAELAALNDGDSEKSSSNESRADDDNSQADSSGSQENRADKPIRVTAVRYSSTSEYTRVTVELEKEAQFESQRIANPDRIVFDLKNTKLSANLLGKSLAVNDDFVRRIRIAQFKPGLARIVIEAAGHVSYNGSISLDPPRLVIDFHADDTSAARSDPRPDNAERSAPIADPGNARMNGGIKKVIVDADDDDTDTVAAVPAKVKPKPVVAASSRAARAKTEFAKSMRESQPTSSGDRSLIRALGLKIGKIVIDPGHGGHDTGTIGPHGLLEKDLVLDVSRRLGKLLAARLGADVVFTRRDDTFIPLETRTAIANQEEADLFVSVHANSSRDPDARGVETYYLNFTSSPEALDVAARENAASDKSIHELQDLVKKIALKEKIEESREFASDIQESLHNGLAAKAPGIRDRGVKKAPFVVLIGANMPSILAEISFISNPGDERRLKGPEYRQRIAESLYRGISRYANSLGGVKVASKMDKSSAD